MSAPEPGLVADLLFRYRRGVNLVVDALADADDAALDRRPPAPDAWSSRMVVHHLADSETNSYVRLRRLLAEPAGTTIQGYDEARWARVLHYERPIDISLEVFTAVRRASAELLEATLSSLPDDAWSRAGQHTETGEYGLLDWLTVYADHAEAHAAQIREALDG
jgi:hypothetical protein